MKQQFIEQVQVLMAVQQIKYTEDLFEKSNYMWLRRKKDEIVWMSNKDEFKIRQALNKVSIVEQNQVIKQLLTWVDENPCINPGRIPEKTVQFLDHAIANKIITEATFSRINSFRNSLRKFSIRHNRVQPKEILDGEKIASRVTFKEEPTIYQICE
ncbi:unnamed protein product [Brassicogethes aeneus]|uniref:Uncharacterized protein n=1 Tax=Brassicogethes aeneus TaxID=1431903 RepID=A0A9P0ATR4_BRAAE|nr:unnamed protein product [Brassicogethes aeneus]